MSIASNFFLDVWQCINIHVFFIILIFLVDILKKHNFNKRPTGLIAHLMYRANTKKKSVIYIHLSNSTRYTQKHKAKWARLSLKDFFIQKKALYRSQ